MRTKLARSCLLGLLPAALTAEPSVATPALHAPPAPPPILRAPTAQPRPAAAAAPAATGTLYSIGTPTDDEQYYLELINRARTNPAAEGARLAATTDPDVTSAYTYFSVDLAMMQAEFAALSPKPPLALNALLTQAARGHTADMFTNVFQGHVGTDGRDLGMRVDATGYDWSRLGENVFSFAKSTWAGHAGFQVDWGGGGTGGMQSGRGHRANIHGDFREVGIGVTFGTKTVGTTTVGPQLVTQDFGSSSPAFVTGVAYYDLDGDAFYDPGEGVGGITVEVSGVDAYAITSDSGGYAVPVPAATTTRSVTFTAADLDQTTNVALTAGSNAKVDFTAAYQPPVLSGSTAIAAGRATTYTFTGLGAASSYDWVRTRKVNAPADAADALTAVTVATTGAYSALSTTLKHSGTAAYHLAHPTSEIQRLTYPGTFRIGPSGTLTFYSRLGWATANQAAQVEVSTNNGITWQPVFSQAGTGTTGEAAFTLRTVSLAAFADRIVQLRFSYRVNGGSYFNQTDLGVGWYIDAIAFADIQSLASATTTAIPTGHSFVFTPAAADTWLLAVRPRTQGRIWPYGPFLSVVVSPPPPFGVWAAQQEMAAGLPAGTIEQNPEGDYNNDGVSNLTAYALGLSATAPATLPTPNVSEDRLRLVYPRDTAKTDITVTAEASSDLITWYGIGATGAPSGFTDALLATVGTLQTREASVPVGSTARLFLRLRIVRP